MKKITIFALHLDVGGAEQCIANLANNLVGHYEVEIIATYKLKSKPAFKLDPQIKVTYLIEKYKPNREAWKKAWHDKQIGSLIKESYQAAMTLYLKKSQTIKAIKNCQSDILISTRALFNNWVGKYGRKGSLKIAWEHNHYHGNLKVAAEVVNSCRQMNYLVLVSPSLAKFYTSKMQEAQINCQCLCIPNMLDYEIPTKAKLTNKHLISVGRFSPEKGMVDLIEVFNLFYQKHPDWHLDLVGDGPLKAEIVKKITTYNLNDAITLHGFLNREQVNNLLQKSALYVMSSYTESFGLVLIEAMSFGIPCLAFDSAEGANDLIVDNKTGYLIKDRNQKEMVTKLAELATNLKKRQAFGQEAQKISLNYTQEKVMTKWFNLLKNNPKN